MPAAIIKKTRKGFHKEIAERAIKIIENFKHSTGEWAGKPFRLLDWQKRPLEKLFGTLNADGTRQYRSYYQEIPRKNGKTELGGGIGTFLLVADGEPGAQIYSAAGDRAQASLVYNAIEPMVRQSPALMERLTIVGSQKRIVYHATNSFYQVLSAEAYCVHPDTYLDLLGGRRKRASEITVGDMVLGDNLAFGRILSIEKQTSSPIYRIETHRGRVILVTGKHRFKTMVGGRRPFDLTHEYRWKTAEALTIGERVAVSLGWKGYGTRNNTEEAWALGVWTGDGECGRCRFTNITPEIVERLRAFFAKKGIQLRSEYSTRQKQNGKTTIQSPGDHALMGNGKRTRSPGREYIWHHFGKDARSHTKDIPCVIWTSGRAAWAAFLAGWLDTDGSVPSSTDTVTWASESLALLISGQRLLARIGINADVRDNVLSVSGREQLSLLAERLGPYVSHPEKRARLATKSGRLGLHDFHGHQSDRISRIDVMSDETAISLEVEGGTHVTDGLITHNSKHGINAHGILFDELHTQPNRDLWDVLRTSTGARRQPLTVVMTTAGYDRNSIAWEIHDYACKVRDGIIKDPTFLPVIYAAPDDADWTDEDVWKACNPALGVFRNLDEMRMMCKQAKEMPAFEMTFRRLYLNQWVNSAERWMPIDIWDASNEKIELEELRGRPCYAGLDLSATTDLTALSLVFPLTDKLFAVLVDFWIPEDTMREKERKDRVPYSLWVKQGLVHVTPGNVIDYDFIVHSIEQKLALYDIREIAFDRWGSQKIMADLQNIGFEIDPKVPGRHLVAFGQGYASMSSPTKELMTLVLQKKIIHNAHPVLRWNVDNLVVTQDPAGNIKPDKAKATQKIDGAVAMIMALDRALRNADDGKSVYEDRGLIEL